MFISQLNDKYRAYDRYGEHFINGVKALFAVQVMMLFYFVSNIYNPYFYYFYAPITCFAAEIIGTTLEEKFLFLTVTLLGTAVTIFLFDIFSIYKTFFVLFAFFYALLFYFIVIRVVPNLMPVVPIVLSLGAYSQLYISSKTSNFYLALNHILEVLAASAMILLAVFLFPRKYYFYMWRRAFFEVVNNLEGVCKRILHEKIEAIPISTDIIAMARFSKMLPRRMKYYSVLKITILTHELVVGMSYLISFQKQLKMSYVEVYHDYLVLLKEACKKREPVVLTPHDRLAFNETHELNVLYKVILSWNYLCTPAS